MNLPIGFLLLVGLVWACASPQTKHEPPPDQQAPWPDSGVFAGYYESDSRKSEFRPAGTTERWWLTGRLTGLPDIGGPSYLVVRGTLGEIKSRDLAGKYQRELVVHDILDPAAAQTAPWPCSGVFSGVYRAGFEKSEFTPAGTTEIWWLSGKKDLGRQPGATVYLTIRGTLSEIGQHGHLGQYKRELVIEQQVVEGDAGGKCVR